MRSDGQIGGQTSRSFDAMQQADRGAKSAERGFRKDQLARIELAQFGRDAQTQTSAERPLNEAPTGNKRLSRPFGQDARSVIVNLYFDVGAVRPGNDDLCGGPPERPLVSYPPRHYDGRLGSSFSCSTAC